jgi:formylglycine-generating enzyme required for sulfatase activity
MLPVHTMAKIFLCHASEDKQKVREVYQRLKEEDFEPWLDEEDLLPGQLWRQEIPKVLRSSDFILIFLSQTSIRKIGYVQNEFKLAIDSWKQIPEGMIHTIPVRLDNCEIPEQFGEFQWVNLFEERGFERLFRAIRTGLEQRQQPQTKVQQIWTDAQGATLRQHIMAALEELQQRAKGPVLLGDITTRLPVQYPSEELRRALERMRYEGLIHFEGVFVENSSVIWLPPPKDIAPHITNSIGMEFVLIPAGQFLMGSDDGYRDEPPIHKVTISQPFFLSIYAVTQREGEAVMGNNPSAFKGAPNRPVEMVSWQDVQEFIRKLHTREGGTKYRLPTEAEWEYAAHAGSTTAYSFGDNPSYLREYVWYNENSNNMTHPVGQLKPNAWGLYDVYGNVREWVQDWYGDYSAGSVKDPQGRSSGSLRVVRSSRWCDNAWSCRSAARAHGSPDSNDGVIGFRLLREIP